jgi:hypothetical protein
MALDPAGHPRVMIVGADPTHASLQAYQYAACDASCTNPGNWTLTRILGKSDIQVENSRYFALDPQGRPRFVYWDNNFTDHKGTYFAYCDAGCATAASWSEVKLSADEFVRPSLAFTAAGMARLAFYMSVAPDWKQYVFYAECSTVDCTSTSGAQLYEIQTNELANEPGGWFALRLDASDRPRLAVYSGNLASGSTLQPNQLYYLWCDSACATGASWTGYSLGLPTGVGTYVELVLDRQNRPRLAYEYTVQGLGYAWCTGNCESTSPSWQSMIAEPAAAVDQSDPIPLADGCSISTWFVGKRPSLALDPAGNPRFGHDAEHTQGGTCTGRTDYRWARFVLLSQP